MSHPDLVARSGRRIVRLPGRASLVPVHPARGLTLVELMIGLVVLGIVSSIAYPTFAAAIRKSRRADAFGAVYAVSQAQERYRVFNPIYASSIPILSGVSAQSPAGHYTIATSTTARTEATDYVIGATANASSGQWSDTRCRRMEMVKTGFNVVYRSYTSAGTLNTGTDPCWVIR